MNDFNFLGTSITGLESSQKQERSWEFWTQSHPIKDDLAISGKYTELWSVPGNTDLLSFAIILEVTFWYLPTSQEGACPWNQPENSLRCKSGWDLQRESAAARVLASCISHLFYRKGRGGGISHHKGSLNEAYHQILEYDI